MQQQQGGDSKWLLMRGGSVVDSDNQRFVSRVSRYLTRPRITDYVFEVNIHVAFVKVTRLLTRI